ncbi:GFA family protein [Parasphingorhabdus halotolerans]|uniref:GFA family protein n=1 Tax=Parasphingorhabdus halotolerans TaxID=2725558 RepID=A0A6H2DQ65_9SPHN|nr:GFA family protein [Parasphingorhabdus halotolerans]QJB70105.1 GFA family protein [Parasphingorhabdus halotolerans]
MTETNNHKGSCLCGAVQIEVAGDLPEADACHCTNCRKQSGHYWASTDIPAGALTVRGEENVSWYQSSEKVRRGFCKTCGSFLFWDANTVDKTAVAMGCFDTPTRTKLWSHIFVADKGDYYQIDDGVLQRDQ